MKTTILLCSLLLLSAAVNVLLGLRLHSTSEELSQLEKRSATQGEAEHEIEALRQRIKVLSLGALKDEGEDFEGAIAKLREAIRVYRDAIGRELKEQFIAEHYAELAIENLSRFGPEYYDRVEQLVTGRDERGIHLQSTMRKRLLDILFGYDPARASVLARRLLEQEDEETPVRLYSAYLLRRHAPMQALESIRGVIDSLRGRDPDSFQNLADLVGILGEVGEELGPARVAPILRDIAAVPTWSIAARNKAISYLETLGVRSATEDLKSIILSGSDLPYVRTSALRALCALDPKLGREVIEVLLAEERLPKALLEQARRRLELLKEQ